MTEADPNDIKVILVGEMGTGKTSLIRVLMGDKFVEDAQMSTSSASFVRKRMVVSGKEYFLDLWDTIGQEKFRSLTKIFIKDSKIVIFVYDITRIKTFTELDFWFKTVKDSLGEDAILGIAGNKKDLYTKEQVKEELIKKYAAEKNVPYKLTSAKEPISFISFMEELLKNYLNKCGGIIESSGGKKLTDTKNNSQNGKKCCK